MSEITGLLIDSTGIQKYIFSSNKLKLNLGASYIIEHLLMCELLKETLKKFSSKNTVNHCNWDEENEVPVLNGESVALAYAGGGRCLLFCKNVDTAKDFADKFSLSALQYFPGITLSATTLGYDKNNKEIKGCMRGEEDKSFFQCFMKSINIELGKARSEHHIVSAPLSPGYVRKDKYNDGYVDPNSLENEGNKNVSLTTASKLQYAEAANKKHREDYIIDNPELNNQDFEFPLDFENVCMEDDQGFLAVVHIDGNGIGSEFQNKDNLKDFQNLSKKVKEVGKETIQKTVENLINLLTKEHTGQGKIADLIKSYQKKNSKQLPFRPIISGGDDITFVTDGHLGLYLAEKCVKNFITVTKQILGEEIHACAGVAIVKRKYPFARAYNLAEELIKSAKKASRAPQEQKYSYIDMYISKAGVSGSLEYVRSQTHERKSGDKTYRLDYGSYLLASHKADNKKRNEFADFICKIREDLATTSRSKVQQLRDALYGTEQNREAYLKRLEEVDDAFYKKLMKNGSDKRDGNGEVLFKKIDGKYVTRWIDAIDFRDFYPLETQLSETKKV